ncbi:D-2-hydroxyacid dehydrogenase family protein [Pigmentiphaga kullae]|uniref:D-3-phosphoglycerate dehydrogenase n=1 Tax=Pigmentiphaga kullae TaxID=151784 RepID=A0A4Q7NH50_9BURK|nr:D-2-hydroxyacid dehydrogenase family protein [Pigmentiphaga kullae]RZS84189.1 D-3-phosphoglycerate dehydrogenase [Pigmentiphaga kullae]
MTFRIVVLDDYSDMFRSAPRIGELADCGITVCREAIDDPLARAGLLANADAVILTQQRSAFPRALIERLPRLRLIGQTGSRTCHIDLGACAERGIVVATGGPGITYPTAELTWALILAAQRHLPYEIRRLKQGQWLSTAGISLRGATLGIYAYGKVGRQVAEIGRAFGMRVVCWGRETSTARARQDGFEVAADRATFFGQSDVLSLHLPLSEETRGIVTAGDLAGMKPDALLVNTSRAALVDEYVLIDALRRGRPGRAAIDVHYREPVSDGGHPLLRMDNVLCTPHLGYATTDNLHLLYDGAIGQVRAFLDGQRVS